MFGDDFSNPIQRSAGEKNTTRKSPRISRSDEREDKVL